jgi:hypothetical protein
MNVLATGRAAAILGERRILLSPKVEGESLYIYADTTKTARQPIDHSLLEAEGIHFIPAGMEPSERILAVRFAALVDDGEAEALAIALARRIPILSDDVAAAKVALSERIPLQTTLDLVRTWSVGRDPRELSDAVIGMRFRANYVPPRSHPQRSWFLAQL